MKNVLECGIATTGEVKVILDYECFAVVRDEYGDYYLIDEDRSLSTLKPIKIVDITDQTDDELLGVDFNYDVSGEDNNSQYWYFSKTQERRKTWEQNLLLNS